MVTGSVVAESCRGGEHGFRWGLSVVMDQRSLKHVGLERKRFKKDEKLIVSFCVYSCNY